MSNLWGFQAGQQQAQLDQQRQQLSDMSLAQGQQNLEKGAVQLDISKILLAQQETMQKNLASMGGAGSQGGDPTSRLADMLNYQGTAALSAGKTVDAARSLTAASTLMKNDVALKAQKAKIDNEKMDTALSLLETGDLKTAALMYQEKYHEALPPQLVQFVSDPRNNNPSTIEKFRQALLSQKDKINIAEKQAVIKKDQAETTLATKTTQLRDKQIKDEKTRAHDLKKAGIPQEVPSWALQAITDQAHAKFGDTADTATLRARSRAAAQQAAIYASQGMSQQQAADKAFGDAVKAGTYAGIEFNRPRMGTLEKPIPLDAKVKPQPNWYYLFPDGRVGRWIGKNFVVEEK